MITNVTNGGIWSTKFSGSEAERRLAEISIGFDYFVARQFSVGANFNGNVYTRRGYGADGRLIDTDGKSISGGVRFGFNLPLGKTVSLYPRLTLGLSAWKEQQQVVGAFIRDPVVGPTSAIGPWMYALVPLIVHPVPHFFLGAGPRYSHSFARTQGGPHDGAEATSIGVDVLLGGWWGGAEVTTDTTREAARDSSSTSHFGSAGALVITGETDGFVNYTTYSGTDSTYFALSFSPGIDYFIGNDFSIGLSGSVARSKATSFDVFGSKIEVTSSGIGIAPRIGLNAPLTQALSIYFRAELGVGGGSWQETSETSENESRYKRVWIGASAPILAHIAPHFFAGIGPMLSHDVSRIDQYNRDNRATTVGASVLIGGWL